MSSRENKPAEAAAPGPAFVAGLTLLLFLVWSNSFVAIGFLLGGELSPRRLDWLELPTLRFTSSSALAALYCFGFHRKRSLEIIRNHWRRLAAAGFFCVPSYNLCLNYAQQHGIPPPVASLETAIAPLFLMILGTLFLGEALSARKIAGFLVSFCGLILIATAKAVGGPVSYSGLVVIAAGAPLSWSLFSVLSKPVTRKVDSLLWTYLAIIAGSVPFWIAFPTTGVPALIRLDAAGWWSLAFLTGFCTLFGFAAWTWLLRFIPASSIGFTIFLNPPLTTVSKAALAALLPGVFAFQIVGREWAGGAVVLVGMAVALLRLPARR